MFSVNVRFTIELTYIGLRAAGTAAFIKKRGPLAGFGWKNAGKLVTENLRHDLPAIFYLPQDAGGAEFNSKQSLHNAVPHFQAIARGDAVSRTFSLIVGHFQVKNAPNLISARWGEGSQRFPRPII